MIEREEAQKIYEHLIQEYIDHLEKRGDIMKLSQEYLERDRELSQLVSSLAFKLNKE
ncbi:MAG: hypothetical protein ACTSQ8_26370 [Candidatus Helarchaeota archaeon]